MTVSFSVTWDYRCPFARNVHEQVLTGLQAGADWDVGFLPFSLGQVHVKEGESDIWDRPKEDSGLLALQAGVLVRDSYPELFPQVHRGLFAARHDQGRHIEDPDVVREVLTGAGVPSSEILERVDAGEGLKIVRAEHEQFAESHDVWGVPTFIAGDQAAFVRLMDRAEPGADPANSLRSIQRVVDMLIGWPELNEFKHTSLSR